MIRVHDGFGQQQVGLRPTGITSSAMELPSVSIAPKMFSAKDLVAPFKAIEEVRDAIKEARTGIQEMRTEVKLTTPKIRVAIVVMAVGTSVIAILLLADFFGFNPFKKKR